MNIPSKLDLARSLVGLCAVLAAGSLVGCAGTPRGSVAIDRSSGLSDNQLEARRIERPDNPRELKVFSGKTGLAASWEGTVARLASADIVLIGETHDNALGQEAAAALFKDVLEVRGQNAALALEFFERDEQNAIDDLQAGIIDLDEMKARLGKTSADFPLWHEQMVRDALEAGVPFVAANAPRRYVRLARTDGFEKLQSLSADQRRLFVVPSELTGGEYRDRFYTAMGAMGKGPEEGLDGPDHSRVEAIYRAQNVWDATMAQTVADLVRAGKGPVFLVVGQFHTDFEGGLTERLRGLVPGARLLSVSVQPVWADERRMEDIDRADLVIYAGPVGE